MILILCFAILAEIMVSLDLWGTSRVLLDLLRLSLVVLRRVDLLSVESLKVGSRDAVPTLVSDSSGLDLQEDFDVSFVPHISHAS